MAIKLTKSAIDHSTFAADRSQVQYLWDSELRGFGIRLYKSGKKSFVIQYRSAGRLKFMVLGQYGHLTLVEARKEAKLKLAEVLRDSDPSERRKQERSSLAAMPTVQQLFDFYTSRPGFRSKSKSHRTGFNKKLEKYVLPVLGRRNVDQVQRKELRLIFESIADTGKHSLAKSVVAFRRR